MKSKTGQESKYREHLLSDINIYLAIYSLNSYIFEYNLLKPEDRHLYHQLQDKDEVSGRMVEILKRLDKMIVYSVENSNQNKIKEFLNSPTNSIEGYQEFLAIKEGISEEEKAQLEEDLKAIKECFRNMDSESISLGTRLYQDYFIKSKDDVKRYKHLKDYVQLHGKMKPSYEIIDALYERYMYEIAQVIVYISYRALTLKDQDDLKKTPIFAEFKECFVKYLRGENDEES